MDWKDRIAKSKAKLGWTVGIRLRRILNVWLRILGFILFGSREYIKNS